MEHMVNFGIVIDDDAITKLVEENIVKQVSADILAKVEKEPGDLPTVTSFRGLHMYADHRVNWSKLVQQAVDGMAEEWKDEVIERTANMLYESVKRTKKYKERMAEVLDD